MLALNLTKIHRKSHPNLQHYVKKIEAQTKNVFLIKRRVNIMHINIFYWSKV